MRSPHRYRWLGAMLLGVPLAVAGCAGHGGTSASSSGGSAPASAPASAAPSTGARPAGPPTSSAAANLRCHTGGLKITSRGLGAAAGSHYAAVVFANTTTKTCRVYGFPGLQLLNKAGDKIATKVVRDPSTKPTLVSLPAGARAYSRIGWAAIPGQGEPTSGHCEATPASTEVTPPDETDHAVIGWSYGPACQHGRITATALAPGAGPTAQ